MYLVPSISPELIDENDFDFHAISTPIATAMDCKQPVLQRPLRGLSSIEPALDLMSTTGLLLDLHPQHPPANNASHPSHPQLPQLKMEPLVDLGNIFDELELPPLHCTAAPDAMMQQQQAAAATFGARVESISPQACTPPYPKEESADSATKMIEDFEEFLSSDDAAYSSDSSGGEPGLRGAHSPEFSYAASQAPPTPTASFARKGGAVRSSARHKGARTARATKSVAAGKSTTFSYPPTTTGAPTSSAGAGPSPSSSAALAAANKKPRKGWKCSCAFLVTSITPRERTKLLKAGVAPPPLGTDPATLTKAQERELRGALRKIRNVASAQKSRRNQKDYITALEKEAAAKDHAIESLESEVETMADTNQSLLSQLSELRSLLYGGSSSAKASGDSVGGGAGGTALLMLAVCCGVGLSVQDPSTAAASTAARFGFDLGMAAIGRKVEHSAADDSIYYTTNVSSDDEVAGGGNVFTPTGFKSRTLQSIEMEDGYALEDDFTAGAGAAAASGGWVVAYVALTAIILVAIVAMIMAVRNKRKPAPAPASSQQQQQQQPVPRSAPIFLR